MSKILPLAERLKLQIQSEQEALESQTSAALNKHQESLKLLSNDALNTMKSVISSENELLIQSINSARTQTLAHFRQLPRAFLMAMLLPVLLTILLCTLIAILTWMWLPTALFQAQTVSKEMPDGKTYTLIVDSNWTTCEVNKKSFPCVAQPQK